MDNSEDRIKDLDYRLERLRGAIELIEHLRQLELSRKDNIKAMEMMQHE